MSKRRADAVEAIFQAAFDLSGHEREAFVRSRAIDSEMADEVLDLFSAYDEKRDSFLETPAVSLEPTAVAPPRRLGAYEVVHLLGRGGMGVVYRAKDPVLGRDVAIKLMPPLMSLDADARARFKNEARLLAAMNHPNIATIYSLEDHGTSTLITMEFVDGDVLADRIGPEPLGVDDAIRIAQQTASALEAAHRAGIVHRDLKPLNVMVNSDGRVKVLDFGLAVALGDAVQSATAGTPGYMSPEQVRGQDIDERTDLWAFGCLLYECLTGRPAFDGASIDDRLSATIRDDIDRSRYPDDCPRSIREIVEHCLTRPLDRRARSARDVRRRLEEVGLARTLPSDAGTPSPATPNNLPASLTPFIGRADAMSQLAARRDEHRIVTLVGAGGTGKSRLALESARSLVGGSLAGIWWIELATVTDPERIDARTATALGVADDDGGPRAALRARLANETALLVFDNCEHVRDRAAELIFDLTTNAPNITVMATSREALGVSGEAVFPVPSLGDEAVDFFVDRARSVHPAFRLDDATRPAVASICERLDGIPLALELAAARLRVLSVDEVAARLGDRFRLLTAGSRTSLPHHRTLRSLIDWSFDQLTDREKTFFSRLSLFVGGFTLSAAEEIAASDDIDTWDVVDVLGQLVSKSLVEMVPVDGGVRYRLLETIRAYAADVVLAPESLIEHYVEFYAELAATLDVAYGRGRQAECIRQFAADEANMLHALDLALARTPVGDPALAIASAIATYAAPSGRWRQARELIERTLATDDGPRDRRARAHLAQRFGNLLNLLHDLAAARSAFDEAFAVWTRLDDHRSMAGILNNLGLLALESGDVDAAKGHFERAMEMNRANGHDDQLCSNLNNLGLATASTGDNVGAASLYRQAVELGRTIGLDEDLATYLSNLSTALPHEHLDDSLAHQEEALAIRRAMGSRSGVSISLLNLASFALEAGDLAKAKRTIAESAQIKHDIGDIRGLMIAFEILGNIYLDEGDAERAARVLAMTHELRLRHDVPARPFQVSLVERIVGDTRAAMADDAFDAAWAAGATTDPETVIGAVADEVGLSP